MEETLDSDVEVIWKVLDGTVKRNLAHGLQSELKATEVRPIYTEFTPQEKEKARNIIIAATDADTHPGCAPFWYEELRLQLHKRMNGSNPLRPLSELIEEAKNDQQKSYGGN